jgi:hypothetical protein
MISYSTVQRPLAVRLHARLKLCGCNPKLDHLDIAGGERWNQTVAWWLSACHTGVVLLSPEALASPWVRYELSVLSNREKIERNARLVLVYVGVERHKVHLDPALAPLQMGDLQSFELADAHPDDDTLDRLVESVHDLTDVTDSPVDRLVSRVCDEIQLVPPDRVKTARRDLAPGDDDPWLVEPPDARRGFAQAYCSTPLDRTYRSLQTLAQDRHLAGGDMAELIDLNVMTTFDSRAVEQLRQAAAGKIRRSLVSATTRADLAEVATRSVHSVHGEMLTFPFVVHGPVSGRDAEEIARGLGDELEHTVEAEEQEEPAEFLEEMADLGHPIYALLANAAGITGEVLSLLEKRFPQVVFVVLSSARQPMALLAAQLEVEGTGAHLDDPTAWDTHVENEHMVATKRSTMRKALLRVKRRIER